MRIYSNLQIFIIGVSIVLALLIFIGGMTALEVWFKRDVLGVPYCISGESKR